MSQSAGKDKSFYQEYFKEIDTLHGLQTTPQEREWLLSVPKGEVRPAQVVLYLGCIVLRTAHLVRTVVDVFKLLNVDFVTVGGVSYYCGIQHYQKGDTDAARSIASTTARNFQKFSPEKVVMWCPSCVFFYDDIMDMKEEFSFQHATQFLVENLDRLDFTQQVNERVSLHYHTWRPQSDEEARCASKLLGAVPGIDLVDLGTDPDLGRHCTAAVRQQLGPEKWDGVISSSFEKAGEAEVDVYSTIYHGCQRILCRYETEYPLRVEHYLTLVGRALGIEHEDLFKKYLQMGDADAILADSSPCSQASGLTEERARAAVQKTFVERAV